jgi:membrane-associated protease RseP (regulator of RpoE activity)
MSPWMALAWLLLLVNLLTLVMTVFMVSASRAMGAPPDEVRIGMGPRLLSRRFLGAQWIIRAIPNGVSLLHKPLGAEESEVEDNALTRLSPPRRMLVTASASTGLLLLALVCLPPARALEAFTSGFEHMVNLVRAPERVAAFFTLLETEGFRSALGVLAVKFAAYNLLPIPLFSGFALLRDLWLWLSRRQRVSPRVTGGSNIFGLVVALVLSAGWAHGLYRGLRTMNERSTQNPPMSADGAVR